MTAVLATANAVCNHRCYDAQGPDCTCGACEGVLHGVGRERAVELAPGLVAGGWADAAMLELPLGEACGNLRRAPQTGSPPEPATSGGVSDDVPRCVRCDRTEAESPRLIRYGVGLVCEGCRRAALKLGEVE